MNINQKTGAFEAILFASGEPVETEKIMQTLEISKKELEYIIDMLEEKYGSKDSGIQLLHLENSLQFCSNSNYIEEVRMAINLKKNTSLSGAAMEVLSLIAYNQPVTKSFIEQVRGVDCTGVINSLSQKELITECGRLELAGRPLVYATTENFLRCFNLTSIEKLPELPKEENKA
ncbi:MAG: SMC-Scp complex subunit ScpB [Clostridia bacterium]